MATERIEIVVSERGTREVKRKLEDVGKGASDSANFVGLLKRALLALGGAALIRGVISIADAFTNVQNRLKNVTESTAQLNVVTQELFEISNRTRSSFEATAQVYARTALAVRELGISQEQTLAFTETLNQAVLLSGASAQEAQAGLIQLSQGLASGALRGDELRSVLEQLPAVADVIARGLGVTRGELRKLGEEGQITADLILEAFAGLREEVGERFAKTVPTVSQAFAVLRNQFIRFIGELNSSTGVISLLAQALIALSNHLDTFARVLGVIITLVGVQFAQVAMGRAITAVRALSVAIAANPIGALATVIVGATVALVAFSDQITVTEDELITLRDVGVAAFQNTADSARQAFEILKRDIGGTADEAALAGDRTKTTFRDVAEFIAKIFDKILGINTAFLNALVAGFQALPGFVEDVFNKVFNGILRITQTGINEFLTLLNKLPKVDIDLVDFTSNLSTAEGQARGFGEVIAEAFKTGFESSTAAQDFVADTFDTAGAVAIKRLEDAKRQQDELNQARSELGQAGERTAPRPGDKEFAAAIQQLETENRLLQLNNSEREIQIDVLKVEQGIKRQLSEEERALLENQLRANQELAIRADLLRDIQGPQEELLAAQQQLNALLAEGSITVAQYELAMTNLKIRTLETGVSAADGFRRGFLRIKADILDVASAAENTLTNAFRGAEDALVSFVTTGEANFSALVDSILADLTRLLARQAIAGLLNSLAGAGGGGGGLGGILSSLASTGAQAAARAEGGPVNSGRPFVVGEEGPELFVPNQSGQVMPNGVAPVAVPAPELNVQVVNVDNPDSVPEAMASQRGDKVILNSLTRNKGAVRTALGIA